MIFIQLQISRYLHVHREIYLTGNDIGVDGTVAMLFELSDAISRAHFTRLQAAQAAATEAALVDKSTWPRRLWNRELVVFQIFGAITFDVLKYLFRII